MINNSDGVFARFYSLATEIGRREYVISNDREVDYARVSDIDIPKMNGEPLTTAELQEVDSIRYRGRRRRAIPQESGVRINVRRKPVVLPFSMLDDVHDRTHILHCLDAGQYPMPESMVDLLNREALEKIYSES